jgi:hypothetical protein
LQPHELNNKFNSFKKQSLRYHIPSGGDLLLFEATHTHHAATCPLLKPEGKMMIKQLFSDENVKKAGIKIAAAYMSCPKDTAADHKGFFTIEAENPTMVTKFFGPMTVEVRPVRPLSEIAKTL